MTYIFDFDGTLADALPYWGQMLAKFIGARGHQMPPEMAQDIMPLGVHGAACLLIERFGFTETPEELGEKMVAEMYPYYENEIILKAGAESYLRELKAAGHHLNILTGSPHRTADPCIRRLGIGALFDCIDSTEDYGLKKTDPEIYTAMLAKLGATPNETVFFDDNLYNLATAKALGITTVGVYDAAGENCIEETRAACDRFIMSFAELKGVNLF